MTASSDKPGADETTASTLDKSSASVRTMFGDIAHRYDFLNHLLSGNQDVRWRRRAMRLLDIKRGQKVLDLCCGTGDLSQELLRRQAECEIVAADFAFPMLELAKGKLASANVPPRLVCADALKLPLESERFDATMCAFGVRNFEVTATGLQEMRRVLKPGGKLLVLEFMRPQSALVQKGFAAFNVVLAPIGRAVCGHPTAYNYLPQSVCGFYTRGEFEKLLRRCGFRDVRKWEHGGGIATTFLAKRI